jgi:hypothetical protein
VLKEAKVSCQRVLVLQLSLPYLLNLNNLQTSRSSSASTKKSRGLTYFKQLILELFLKKLLDTKKLIKTFSKNAKGRNKN